MYSGQLVNQCCPSAGLAIYWQMKALVARVPFHKHMSSSAKYCRNSCCSCVENNDQISSQFCMCHNSWAVVAHAKLWADLAIIFHVRATCIFAKQDLGYELIHPMNGCLIPLVQVVLYVQQAARVLSSMVRIWQRTGQDVILRHQDP